MQGHGMRTLFLFFFIFSNIIADQATFTLMSDDLGGQVTDQFVFDGFGYEGGNVSPELKWNNPPEGVKSYAITMYDPDAPTGSGWWHWVVFNISADVLELPKNAGELNSKLLPEGAIQSETSFGLKGYGGPAPPKGDRPHAYIITVYALDVEKIDLDDEAQPAKVGYYLNQYTIQKASIISYFQSK